MDEIITLTCNMFDVLVWECDIVINIVEQGEYLNLINLINFEWW